MPYIVIKKWKIKIVRKRVRVARRSGAEEKKLRIEARKIVMEKLAHFNQHYALEYKKIFIKNQKTRWGSCSSRKNLNFNYRIALLPPKLQDYLVVHELCHLQEMNHGANFWKLVAEQVPQYRECRDALRKFSL